MTHPVTQTFHSNFQADSDEKEKEEEKKEESK